MRIKTIGILLTLFIAVSFRTADNGITYSKDIKPIWDRKCSYCHSENRHIYARWGGDLNTWDSLKIRIDNGKLKERIVTKKDMPPAEWHIGGLPQNEISLIDSWLNAGAKY